MNFADKTRAAQAFFSDATIIRRFPAGENEVYEISVGGERRILRIVPFEHRSLADIESELTIIVALKEKGYPAAAPSPSKTGEYIIKTSDGWASSFEFAEGEPVEAFGPHWNESLFVRWGETLAQLHVLSKDLKEAEARFAWFDDPAVQRMPEVLNGERVATDSFHRLVESVPREGLQLVHGDLGLPNFHRTDEGRLTVFDFDDCCRHHRLYDVATALWPLRRRERSERDRYLNWMLSGYVPIGGLQRDWKPTLQAVFDWRNLYLFAHFLWKWGPSPDEQQAGWLEGTRAELKNPVIWV